MLTVLALLGVLLVLFAAAVIATREGPILAEVPADVADVTLPAGALQPEDVRGVRFGLAVRGYRMSEVDDVLDRLAAELADRDARIAELERRSRTAAVAAPAARPVVAPERLPEPAPEPIVPVAPRAESTEARAIEVPPASAPEPPLEPPAPAPAPEPPLEPPAPEPAPQPPLEPPAPEPPPIVPAEPATPVVPAEPVQPPSAATPDAPPVDVAMVPVEVAPLPERPAGESEGGPRD